MRSWWRLSGGHPCLEEPSNCIVWRPGPYVRSLRSVRLPWSFFVTTVAPSLFTAFPRTRLLQVNLVAVSVFLFQCTRNSMFRVPISVTHAVELRRHVRDHTARQRQATLKASSAQLRPQDSSTSRQKQRPFVEDRTCRSVNKVVPIGRSATSLQAFHCREAVPEWGGINTPAYTPIDTRSYTPSSQRPPKSARCQHRASSITACPCAHLPHASTRPHTSLIPTRPNSRRPRALSFFARRVHPCRPAPAFLSQLCRRKTVARPPTPP